MKTEGRSPPEGLETDEDVSSPLYRPTACLQAAMTALTVASVASPPLLYERPHLPMVLPGEIVTNALYDTGAPVSIIDERMFRQIPIAARPSKVADHGITLSGINASPLNIRGLYCMNVKLLGQVFQHTFFVVQGLSSEAIIGMDFISKFGLVLDPLSREVFVAQSPWREACIISAEKRIIPANSAACISVQAYHNTERAVNESMPTMCVASVNCTLVPLVGKDALVTIRENGHTNLIVENLSDIDVEIPRGTYIGSVEKVSSTECKKVEFDIANEPASAPPPKVGPEDDFLTVLTNLITQQTSHLPPDLQDQYVDLIKRNHDIFSRDKHDLGRTHIMEHSIHMKDNAPVYVKQFRIPETHRSILIEHLNNWLKLGVVSPSKSNYNSPIFCVPKKDGSLRPVLDFRAINDKSFIDKYSQREIQDCIDEIGRAKSKVFSSLDLTAGFWQLPLEKSSRKYTAFTIPGLGSFEWNCAPMGLLGCPASFGRLTEYIVKGLRAIAYQDDILVHSSDHARHLLDLQACFDRFRAHGLKLNLKKCHFGQNEVAYLGFLLTEKGIKPGKDKLAAIAKFPPPATVRQVREFVGICNYFRASVPKFSLISQPLTHLTRKDCSWKGGTLPPNALESYEKLKSALLNAPTLAYPDPKLDYHLLVDGASGGEKHEGGLGACLVQIDDHDVPHAIGYASRSLSPHEKNYSAYLLELTAACFGIQYFDVYLRGRPFTLYSDHRPMEKLGSVHTRTLNRLQQLMLEYNFKIQYKPGSENTAPDFLSRNPVSAVDINYDHLVKMQRDDPLISDLIIKLQNSQLPLHYRSKLILKNHILYYAAPNARPRIFAPKEIQGEILQAYHASLLGGHMGIFKTSQRIIEKYYWPNIIKDVEYHVRHCIPCQQSKVGSRHARPPLQPLPQPPNINHRVHMDLYGPLAVSERGKKYVMVLTDAFSKYVELVALENKEAATVARAFFETWVTRYSTPHTIVTDNGKEFSNKLMKELCSILKIYHKTTSPYHPECNAQAEVFNRSMRQYLQTVMAAPYLDWEQYLPALRMSYNTSVSKATLKTPFSLLFGFEANMPYFDFEMALSYNEDLPEYMNALELARNEVKDRGLIYKTKYSLQYDRKHKVQEPKLEVGELIFVDKVPDQKLKNPKLHPRFEGPYPITRLNFPNVYYKKGRKELVTHINRIKRAHISLSDPINPDEKGGGGAKNKPPPLISVQEFEIEEMENESPKITPKPPVPVGHRPSKNVTFLLPDPSHSSDSEVDNFDDTANISLPNSPFPPTPAPNVPQGAQFREFRASRPSFDTDSEENDESSDESVDNLSHDPDVSRMDTHEASHVYHDQTMHEPRPSSKRQLSPPSPPVAKRREVDSDPNSASKNPSSESSESARASSSSVPQRPARVIDELFPRSSRSKGKAPPVEFHDLPLESGWLQRRREKEKNKDKDKDKGRDPDKPS